MENLVNNRARLRLWFVYFLFISTMSAGLSLITPHYGGPDEPAHTTYLYTVIHGNIPMNSDVQELPAWLDEGKADCWALKYDQAATCSGSVDDSHAGLTGISTSAANYPPLYYLLVGLPIKFLTGTTALRAIRFLSSLLFAALAALGLSFLRTNNTQYRSDIFAFLLITPSAYALAGFIQPQALEIGAAIALAGILLPIAHVPEEADTRLKWAIPITFLLVLSRTTGMWWAFMICVLVFITLTKKDMLVLVKKRMLWIFVATSAVWCSLSLWWTLGTKDWYDLRSATATPHSCDIFSCIIPNALRPGQFAAVTAVTGWNDTRPPILFLLLFWVVIVVFVAFAFRTNKRKTFVTTLFLVVLYIVSSVVMSVSWVDIWGGPIWQGRYALPIILAYLIFVADTVSRSSLVSSQLSTLLVRASSVILALLFMSFALSATVRFWSGLGNGVSMLQGPFYAPLFAQVGLVLCILACIALCVIAWHANAYTNKLHDKVILDGESKLDNSENESGAKISS